ncbi:InlB B-repeat-containing protein [Lachnospiraceae bacterium OttesenSCG-928-J05]|nr:InlB B-repeat-containing protein [Lachnospiraceae bacterium OttesenSCG-928-J05]
MKKQRKQWLQSLLGILLALTLVCGSITPVLADDVTAQTEETQGSSEEKVEENTEVVEESGEESLITEELPKEEPGTDNEEETIPQLVQEEAPEIPQKEGRVAKIGPQDTGSLNLVAEPSTNEYQTFVNEDSGKAPQPLTVTLKASFQSGITGAQVEVPLTYRPTGATHPNFTMTDDIFVLDESSIDLKSDSMYSGYEIVKGADGTADTLVLKIKDNLSAATVDSLTLRFDFNAAKYLKTDGAGKGLGLIDNGSVLWNLQPVLRVDGEVKVTAANQEIRTVADTVIEPFGLPLVPTNNQFSGGILSLQANYKQFDWYQADFDPSYKSVIYIEIPEEAEIKDSPTLDFFNEELETNSDNPAVPVGYKRYTGQIANTSDKWNEWQYGGALYYAGCMYEPRISFPDTMEDGTKFKITIGADYKKMNGAIQTTSASLDYEKVPEQEWKLENTGFHYTKSDWWSVVSKKADNQPVGVYVSTDKYVDRASTKNSGSKAITGVSLELNQESTGSGKVNFSHFLVYPDSLDPDKYPTPYVKLTYQIKDASDQVISQGETEPSNEYGKRIELPPLADGHYYDNVTAVPMGTAGNAEDEGKFPPKTSVGFYYEPKQWADYKWPDGTEVGYNTPLTLQWTLFYDTESGDPTSWPSQDHKVYYSDAPYARVDMVSSNANGKKPGESVSYEVQGYNDGIRSDGDLLNPRIVIVVPKVLELQDIGTPKDFIDVVNQKTETGAVAVSLVSSDENYNYYNLQADEGLCGAIVESEVSYKIPLEFKVAAGAQPGYYPIPAVAVTQKDATKYEHINGMYQNNLESEMATAMGFVDGDNYTGMMGYYHSPLSIVPVTALSGTGSVKSASTENAWVTDAFVPATHDEIVEMKATLTNTGNTDFDNLKIYNILPSSTDGRGSDGNVSFEGVNVPDALDYKIYYTDVAITELPTYDEINLATYAPSEADIWKENAEAIGGAAKATAIYIEFGTHTIAAGESLDAILKFKIPSSGSQVAYNQFKYYALEKGDSPVFLQAYSSKVGFGTQLIQLTYDQNLPSKLPSDITGAENMPIASSGIYGIVAGNKFAVSNQEPTLAGYEFINWKDGAGNEYSAGGEVFFSEAGEIILKAQWKAVNVTVNFDKNGGETEASPASIAYPYGSALTASALPGTNPTRAGHEFLGWATTNDATVADFGDGTEIDFISEKTVYAVWKLNEYKITYHLDGGEATSNPTKYTYGVGVSSFAPTSKSGHLFLGWYDSASGGTEVVKIEPTDTGDKELYAYFAKTDVNGEKGKIGASHFSYAVADESGTAMPPIDAAKAKVLAKVVVAGFEADGSTKQELDKATVDSAQLQHINDQILAGIKGQYELTFYTQDYDKDANTGDKVTITVTLTGVGTIEDGKGAIGGTNFIYGVHVSDTNLAQADDLTANLAKELGKAWANDKHQNKYQAADITVNADELKAINKAKGQIFAEGNRYKGERSFNLTFGSPDNLTVGIRVTLFDYVNTGDDGRRLGANGVRYDVIGGELDEASMNALSNVYLEDKFGNEIKDGVDTSVEDLQKINKAIGERALGEYTLAYQTTDKKLGLTIPVTLIGTVLSAKDGDYNIDKGALSADSIKEILKTKAVDAEGVDIARGDIAIDETTIHALNEMISKEKTGKVNITLIAPDTTSTTVVLSLYRYEIIGVDIEMSISELNKMKKEGTLEAYVTKETKAAAKKVVGDEVTDLEVKPNLENLLAATAPITTTVVLEGYEIQEEITKPGLEPQLKKVIEKTVNAKITADAKPAGDANLKNGGKTSKKSIITTGDNSWIALWTGIVILALLTCIIIFLRRKKYGK